MASEFLHVDVENSAGLTLRQYEAAVIRVARFAGSSALRSAMTTAGRLVRERKAVKLAYLRSKILKPIPPQAGGELVWRLRVKNEPLPVGAFPHSAVGRRGGRDARGRFEKGKNYRFKGTNGTGGVAVTINAGKRAVIRGAFIATLKSGHEGVFKREGRSRLPIEELYTSRVIDVFNDPDVIPAVLGEGRKAFVETFNRNLSLATTRGRNMNIDQATGTITFD